MPYNKYKKHLKGVVKKPAKTAFRHNSIHNSTTFNDTKIENKMKIANEHDTLEGQIIVDLEMDDLLNKLEVYLFKSIDLLSRFNYKFLIIERR
jgi:hypothetical protein